MSTPIAALAGMTCERADDWYRRGGLSQAEYEGYMWAWSFGKMSADAQSWQGDVWSDAREVGMAIFEHHAAGNGTPGQQRAAVANLEKIAAES